MNWLFSSWYGILLLCLMSFLFLIVFSVLFYKPFFKRFYGVFFSSLSIIILSPLLLVLIVLGAIFMRGNPFFIQKRPGKNEKIFPLIKFRTMNKCQDSKGALLPDEKRLTKYGKFLRSSSLDELPELLNIFLGQMSFVGPRPLLTKYLPLYSPAQHRRHEIRPGLTGYAQVHGRNLLSWPEKFSLDVWYVDHVSLGLDIKIIFETIKCVLTRSGINSQSNTPVEEFKGNSST